MLGHARRMLMTLSLLLDISCTSRSADESGEPDTFARVHATPAARTLAERLINAHGGLSAWRETTSLQYTQTLLIPGEAQPWTATETVEQEPARRLYQHWISPPGSRLAWNGREVWTVDWKLDNPPQLMPFLTYYSLITPWLSLDPGATLEATGRAPIPGVGDSLFETLTIRLPADTTRPPSAGYYKVYLDPTDHHMRAMSYTVTYGRLLDAMGLPREVQEMGPITHVYEGYTSVRGLLLPTRYRTVGPDGTGYGDHEVTDWSASVPFEERQLERPTGAVIDPPAFRRGAFQQAP